MDLAESNDDVTVRIELPGVNPEDVEISVSGNVLSVRGEKQQDREEKRRDYLYAERAFGSFARSVTLPSSVDPDKVDATYKDGVLTVKLAKRADAKPKRIPVRTG